MQHSIHAAVTLIFQVVFARSYAQVIETFRRLFRRANMGGEHGPEILRINRFRE